MEEYLKQALDIVKAQASVRTMTEDELGSMMHKLAFGIKQIAEGAQEEVVQEPIMEPSKAIKEKSITCLECGKAFKILTRKHLLSHELSMHEYREKYGYKKGIPLVCKSLQRERRKKMKDMRLWEKRKKKVE